MTTKQQLTSEGVRARQFESEEGTTVVADLGATTSAAVDVVDGTAIVVAGNEQYEFDVDTGARAFIRNGVLTIEGKK